MNHKYGDCIPASKELAKSIPGALVVNGWITVPFKENLHDERLYPRMDFLHRFFPKEHEKCLNDNDYTGYPRAIDHTWIMVNDKIMDPTSDQFEVYGGITKYYTRIKSTFKQYLQREIKAIKIDYKQTKQYLHKVERELELHQEELNSLD